MKTTTVSARDLMANLTLASGWYEAEAVDEALKHRELITPYLIEILECALKQDRWAGKKADYVGHLYAIVMIGKLRETRAHLPLLQLCLLPEHKFDYVFGGFTDYELEYPLAATCGGDISGLARLAADPAACDEAKEAVIDAMVIAAALGEVTRETAIGCLRDLFHTLERSESDVWDALVHAACDLRAKELQIEVFDACEDGLTLAEWYEVREPLNRDDYEFGRSMLARNCIPHYDPDETNGWWDACE